MKHNRSSHAQFHFNWILSEQFTVSFLPSSPLRDCFLEESIVCTLLWEHSTVIQLSMRNFRINSRTWKIHIWSRYCTLFGFKVSSERRTTAGHTRCCQSHAFPKTEPRKLSFLEGTQHNCAIMFLSSAMRRMSFPLRPGESFYASVDAKKAFVEVESVRKKEKEENLHNFALRPWEQVIKIWRCFLFCFWTHFKWKNTLQTATFTIRWVPSKLFMFWRTFSVRVWNGLLDAKYFSRQDSLLLWEINRQERKFENKSRIYETRH